MALLKYDAIVNMSDMLPYAAAELATAQKSCPAAVPYYEKAYDEALRVGSSVEMVKAMIRSARQVWHANGCSAGSGAVAAAGAPNAPATPDDVNWFDLNIAGNGGSAGGMSWLLLLAAGAGLFLLFKGKKKGGGRSKARRSSKRRATRRPRRRR